MELLPQFLPRSHYVIVGMMDSVVFFPLGKIHFWFIIINTNLICWRRSLILEYYKCYRWTPKCNLPPAGGKLHQLVYSSAPHGQYPISVNAGGATGHRRVGSCTEFATHQCPVTFRHEASSHSLYSEFNCSTRRLIQTEIILSSSWRMEIMRFSLYQMVFNTYEHVVQAVMN